jgi:hypothetical protein
MKETHPVRYWTTWIGGLGLLTGFVSGLAGFGGSPAVALGMALPIGLIFAGVGAVVGLIIIKRKSG